MVCSREIAYKNLGMQIKIFCVQPKIKLATSILYERIWRMLFQKSKSVWRQNKEKNPPGRGALIPFTQCGVLSKYFKTLQTKWNKSVFFFFCKKIFCRLCPEIAIHSSKMSEHLYQAWEIANTERTFHWAYWRNCFRE